jgi:homoserine kinase type II
MKSVFLLWHIHELEDQENDEKLIGVYSTEGNAREAIRRVISQPGFRDYPEGFQITQYEIGKDHWTEGFVTLKPEE